MVLATHDLGCHISRCAGCILRILFTPHTSNTEVRDTNISCENQIVKKNATRLQSLTIGVDYKILGFYISVNDTFLMKIFQSRHKTSHEEA